MDINKLAAWFTIVGGAVAMFVTIAGGIWYAAKLDDRISALETRVHELTVAPAIAGVAAGGSGSAPASGAGSSGANSAVVNPIPQTCATLALELPKIGPSTIEASALRDEMNDLGCFSRAHP